MILKYKMAATTLNPFSNDNFFSSDVDYRKLDLGAMDSTRRIIKHDNEGEKNQSSSFQSPSKQLVSHSSNNNFSQRNNQFRAQMQSNLEKWEQLHQRELELIQIIKNYHINCGEESENPNVGENFRLKSPQLVSEIFSLLEQKSNAINPLFQAISSSPNGIPKLLDVNNLGIRVSQKQPSVVVVNQFIDPAPIVKIEDQYLSQELDTSELFVSVSLYYHDSDKKVERDILQGVTRVGVLKDGSAVFDKLLITEVSAKHRYQSFVFCFSLEIGYNARRVISKVNSSPFHTQTRAARAVKRRREEDGYGSSSDEDFVLSTPEKAANYDLYDSKPSGTPTHSDYNYVDISEYLTLPQKEAASKLGISESMLCKRFKECTRRKWPYRYIRKIDKIISMLSVKDGTPLTPEDKKKLEKLMKEREERLQPVKIRITQHDRTAQVTCSPSPPSPMDSQNETSSIETSPIGASTFDDEAQFVMETLEMLKTTRRK